MHQLLVKFTGPPPGPITVPGHHRVEQRIRRIDAGQGRLKQLPGGQLTGAQPPSQLDGGQQA